MVYSPKTAGLVDYEDDEDDEDYRPPPKRQKDNPDDEEATMDSFRLKRKLAPKDKEPDISKRPRLNKNPKSKDSVFAALCSTLSQAVLPSKKTASIMHSSSQAGDGDKDAHEQNHKEFSTTRGSSDGSSSDDETHKEKESASPRSCSECVQSTSDNRQLGTEDTSLVQPKSSPEMAVNGS